MKTMSVLILICASMHGPHLQITAMATLPMASQGDSMLSAIESYDVIASHAKAIPLTIAHRCNLSGNRGM